MLTIEIGNSESKITGVDSNMMSKLKDVLSYETAPTMNYYTKSFSSHKRTLLSKQGIFPTGCLKTLVDALESYRINYSIVDRRVVPKRKEGMFKLNLEG